MAPKQRQGGHSQGEGAWRSSEGRCVCAYWIPHTFYEILGGGATGKTRRGSATNPPLRPGPSSRHVVGPASYQCIGFAMRRENFILGSGPGARGRMFDAQALLHLEGGVRGGGRPHQDRGGLSPGVLVVVYPHPSLPRAGSAAGSLEGAAAAP